MNDTAAIHPEDTLRSDAVRLGLRQSDIARRGAMCVRSVSLLWNGEPARIETFQKHARACGRSLSDTVAMWERSGNRRRAGGLLRHRGWSRK